MGMYPPGQFPPGQQPPKGGESASGHFMVMKAEQVEEMTLHSSPNKKERGTKNSKSGNRNIQAKRLSSQTIINRSNQGGLV